MSSMLTDSFDRHFYYLRLSITEVCNFRCVYCLPNGYQSSSSRKSFLTVPEIARTAQAFAELGIEKIRLTGGEPTMRRDFVEIIAAIKENSQIRSLAVTTNGYRMERDVEQWKSAGLDAVNVSLDSLDSHQFYAITGQNTFNKTLRGIDKAIEAGFSSVKINTVLMKQFNAYHLEHFLCWIKNRPIQLRFIELMQTNEGQTLFLEQHISGKGIKKLLLQKGWRQRVSGKTDGPAQLFFHPDYLGEIGLIMPYEPTFCNSCNRLRISSKGKLHLCLFTEHGIDLRHLLQEDAQKSELQSLIIETVLSQKKAKHFLHENISGATNNLSIIGG